MSRPLEVDKMRPRTFHVHYEELSAARRVGGIEAATRGLVVNLERLGVHVTRSSEQPHKEKTASPDCVHIHGIWSPRLFKQCVFWRSRGVPCVVSPHGMLEPWALKHKRLKKWLGWYLYQRDVLNKATVLHATSEREAQNFSRLGLRSRIEIVSWGVDIPELSNARSAVLSASRSFRTALFVGRIYPVKGLPMLVRAWAKVRPAGWKMRIVGPDEAGHRAELESLVRSLGVEGSFEFTGAMAGEDLKRAYIDADLFILPSHTENFGFVVGEALAHRLPVIVSRGAPWEGIEGHNCGWWTEVSESGIAHALEEATKLDTAALHEMGCRGRDWIVREFSWHGTAERMEALYESAIRVSSNTVAEPVRGSSAC